MTHPQDCLQLIHWTEAVLIHCTVEKICCSGRVFDDNSKIGISSGLP